MKIFTSELFLQLDPYELTRLTDPVVARYQQWRANTGCIMDALTWCARYQLPGGDLFLLAELVATELSACAFGAAMEMAVAQAIEAGNAEQTGLLEIIWMRAYAAQLKLHDVIVLLGGAIKTARAAGEVVQAEVVA